MEGLLYKTKTNELINFEEIGVIIHVDFPSPSYRVYLKHYSLYITIDDEDYDRLCEILESKYGIFKFNKYKK